jgi:hypothetical protein
MVLLSITFTGFAIGFSRGAYTAQWSVSPFSSHRESLPIFTFLLCVASLACSKQSVSSPHSTTSKSRSRISCINLPTRSRINWKLAGNSNGSLEFRWRLSLWGYGVSVSVFHFIFTLNILQCRDTVNSVGLTPGRMPSTRSNPAVKTIRHALALDEHRAKFKPVHCPPPNWQGIRSTSGNKTPRGESLLVTSEGTFANDPDGGKDKRTIHEVCLSHFFQDWAFHLIGFCRCGLLGATLVRCSSCPWQYMAWFISIPA